MALIEDMFKNNLLIAAGLGTTAVVLPKVLPTLPAALRSLVKDGVSLFLESESEAEGGIIERLAYDALKNALQALSGPGSEAERRAVAQNAVDHFKRTARTRAHRYAHNEHDRSARYKRHIAGLHHAIRQQQSRQHGTHKMALDRLLASLDEA